MSRAERRSGPSLQGQTVQDRVRSVTSLDETAYTTATQASSSPGDRGLPSRAAGLLAGDDLDRRYRETAVLPFK